MKRSFREPKNLFKNKAKLSCKKMNRLKTVQSIENKAFSKGRKPQKKPKLVQDTAQIRHNGDPTDD